MTDSVLVTGGAGFIGSTLVDRLLAEGRRVIAVDNLSSGRLSNLAEAREEHGGGAFEFHRLDLTAGSLEPLVAKTRPDVIIHLAAQTNVRQSVDDPLKDAQVNVLGTLQVLEAARRHRVRKVVSANAGSAIYGEPEEVDLPVTELYPVSALSPHGASQIAAEEYLRTYGHLHGIAWTSLALGSVYGPRQDAESDGGVVAILTQQMMDDQPVTVHGDGEQTRDFVFVDDVVHAFVLAMERGDGERCNIGTGERTTVNQLVRALTAATGYAHAPIHGPARAGEARHNAISPSKAAQVLGWKPWTSLEEGLARTLHWELEVRPPRRR